MSAQNYFSAFFVKFVNFFLVLFETTHKVTKTRGCLLSIKLKNRLCSKIGFAAAVGVKRVQWEDAAKLWPWFQSS